MTSAGGAAPGLAFETPDGWFTVSLPRSQAQAGRLADQLADALAAPDPGRDALRVLLGDLVRAESALQIVTACAGLLDLPGGPVPVTLLLSVTPLGGHTLAGIAQEMSAGGGGAAASADMVELPAGPAVRAERAVARAGPADGARPAALAVSYVAQAPGTGMAVVFTFWAPAVAAAAPLRGLFHEIASTLRFHGMGQVA